MATTKAGKAYFSPMYEVISTAPEDLVADFNSFFYDPAVMEQMKDDGEMDPRTYKRNLQGFIDFCRCFEIELTDEVDPEVDFIGKTGWVIPKIKHSEEFGDSNEVKKFIERR